MLDWLKEILGEHYTDEIDKAVAKQISKDFVSRADFNAKNESYKALEGQLAGRDSQLEELKKVDAAGLNARISELQNENQTAKAEYEKRISDIQFNHALDSALTGAKAKNVKAVKALLDTDGLTLNDGEILGLKERLEKVKEENSYLFESDKQPPKFVGTTPGAQTGGDMKAVRAAMGLPMDEK